MDSRNPSDKKRRAIEGLLSGKKSEKTNDESNDIINRGEPLQQLEDDPEITSAFEEVSPEHQVVKDDFQEELEAEVVEDEEIDLQDEETLHLAQEISEDFDSEPGPDIENEVEEDVEPAGEPAREEKRSNLIKYVAIAIVVIGISAAGLILVRDQLYGFFAGFAGSGGSDADQAELIDELESENSRLKQLAGDAEKDSVEIRNLRTANNSLQSMLEVEKQKNQRLEEELGQLKTEGVDLTQEGITEESIETGEDENYRSRQLETRLEEEKNRGDKLAEELQDLNRRMINYSRENSRLNEELEEAKDEIDQLQYLKRDNNRLRNQKETLSRQLRTANSQIEVLQSNTDDRADSSTQLEKVNLEYRRVLDLLQESRKANNIKQAKVDELMSENTKLQSKVSRLEKSQKRQQDSYVSNSGSSSSYGDYTNRDNNTRVTAPYPIDIVRPKYPSSAWRRKVGGVVTLRVYVNKYGDVSDARVVSSPDRLHSLDKAALAAVKKWKFMPGKRNGRPVDMWHDIPLEFTMNRE